MTKKLPIWFKILGMLVRCRWHFKGKWKITQWLGSSVRGKGFRTVVTLRGGEQLLLNLDDWIPYRVFLTGEYDIESIYQRCMFQHVKSGMTILDVGANIGYYTVQFAARVGPTGCVHVFEPVSSIFASLQSNIKLNNLSNVFANQLVCENRKLIW